MYARDYILSCYFTDRAQICASSVKSNWRSTHAALAAPPNTALRRFPDLQVCWRAHLVLREKPRPCRCRPPEGVQRGWAHGEGRVIVPSRFSKFAFKRNILEGATQRSCLDFWCFWPYFCSRHPHVNKTRWSLGACTTPDAVSTLGLTQTHHIFSHY
jgi:hypothetical protein